MKYIHKPTEVEAIQYTGENFNNILEFIKSNEGEIWYQTMSGYGKNDVMKIHIRNFILNERLDVEIGDYIIKGEKKGDFWVCTPDVFEKSYEVKE